MPANDRQEIVEIIISKIETICQLSDYEKGFIRTADNLLSMQLPTTRTSIYDRVKELTDAKKGIDYIIFKLKEELSLCNRLFNVTYNKEFVKYTNLGRPSKASIDSEIFFKNPDLYEKRIIIERINSIIELLDKYTSYINRITNNVENRRFDV